MSPRDWVKRTAGAIGVGLRNSFGRRVGNRLGILVYHRTTSNIPGVPRPSLNVTPERFRAQLCGLLDQGFSFWPLRRVLEYRNAGQAVPTRTVVVTFDDGFGSVNANACPVLKELNIPATLFVSTAYVDATTPFPFDRWANAYKDRIPRNSYQPLTKKQCRELVDEQLVDVGAHTHTHGDFRGRAVDFAKDLQTSIDMVRSWFGLQEVMFAYPFGKPSLGYVDDELVRAAKCTDVICGLTTEDVVVDVKGDPFWWGRFNVYDWDTSQTIAAKLDGWYTWAPKLQEQFSRAWKGHGKSKPDGRFSSRPGQLA